MTTKTADAAHANLAAALAAVQREIPSVAKGATATVQTKTGGEYKYQYADLAVITPLILPLLGRNGLAFTAQPTLVGDAFVLQYTLAHESGETVAGMYPLPDPIGAKPQEIGSAITYARRYALCAVTGVAPGGDDDDAASANDKPAAARKPRAAAKPKAPEPVPTAANNWALPIADAATVDDLRAIHADVEKAEELGLQFDPAHRVHVEQLADQHGLDVPPSNVTVSQKLNAVRKAIEARAIVAEAEMEAADEDGEWPVVQIPTGEETEK